MRCKSRIVQDAARFYCMHVERDLFGRVVLVRRWGRLGTFGKVRLDEGRALQALMAIEARKKRRGYRWKSDTMLS